MTRFTLFISLVFLFAISPSLLGVCCLNLPKGWECIRDKEQLPDKIEVIYVGKTKGQFTPSVNVASEETTLTPKEYLVTARKYHESQGDTTCSTLGTLTTRAGEALMMQIDRTTQWGPMRFVQAIILSDGKAYVITATCLQEEFPSLSPQFFKAIQTFVIE